MILAYHSKPLPICIHITFFILLHHMHGLHRSVKCSAFLSPNIPWSYPRPYSAPHCLSTCNASLHTKRPPISKSPTPMLLSIWSPFSMFPHLNVLGTPPSNSSSTCTDSIMSLIPCVPMFLLYFNTSYYTVNLLKAGILVCIFKSSIVPRCSIKLVNYSIIKLWYGLYPQGAIPITWR